MDDTPDTRDTTSVVPRIRQAPHVACAALKVPPLARPGVEARGNPVRFRDCPAAVSGNESCIMALA